MEVEAGVGAASVQGVGDAPPYYYPFSTVFASAPGTVLAIQAGVADGNGGWAQGHGSTAATATGLFLSIDEDQIGDGERSHQPE